MDRLSRRACWASTGALHNLPIPDDSRPAPADRALQTNPMAKDEDYRRLADQFLMLANKRGNRHVRAILLHMAQQWMRLADKE